VGTPEQLGHIDSLLFYGELDLAFEIEADLYHGLVQPARSMFYSRDYGAGVEENAPQGLLFEVGTRFRIADWIARRNLEVTDGSGGSRDRRVLASQASIAVESPEKGAYEVSVGYIPYSTMQQQSVRVSRRAP
jgi:hypothetical protein